MTNMGPFTRPLLFVEGDLLEQLKTQARRLVSLLHTQTGVSHERVSSTVVRLVELTSLLGVHEKSHGKSSEASPSEDRADPPLPSVGERASGRESQSEEAPEEAPQEESVSSEDVEPWLDDEQWNG